MCMEKIEMYSQSEKDETQTYQTYNSQNYLMELRASNLEPQLYTHLKKFQRLFSMGIQQ